MPDNLQVNGRSLEILVGDITLLEVDAFVFYADPDLQLGSGFGTAISVRGGPAIQEELNLLAPVQTPQVVISSAGKLEAKHILHAVGPRFQEEDLSGKLRATMENCLRLADEKGLRSLAFPAMGAGFYGVPLPLCAEVMLGSILEHLSGEPRIQEVQVCLLDQRECSVFRKQLGILQNRQVA
jgi:O-acetyl-ADP-ribose deacetylase (regulator of RNase III)